MATQPSHSRLSFIALCCWNLMIAIDSTALSVALPVISNDLHASSISTYWAGTSFVLCSAIVQPIFAMLSVVSQRYSILTALAFFSVGSLISALARSIETLIAGRCLQGIGGGGLLVFTYVVMAHLFELEQRSRYMSYIGMIWTIGTILGPVVGGGFTIISWASTFFFPSLAIILTAHQHWIFWINLPMAAISYILIILFFRVETKRDTSVLSRLWRLDWTGCLIFAISLTLLLVAISWGGVMFAWISVGTVFPLLLGATGLALWVLYSYRLSSNPIVPLVVINDRTAAVSYVGTFIHGLTQSCLIYNLPLYYEGVKGYSTLIAGVALLPQCLTSGPFTAIAGLLIAKTHLTKPFSILGWLIYAYGILALTLLNEDTSVFSWIILNIPSGIGLGVLFSSLSLATQASAENRAHCSLEERANVKTMAASLNPFFRALGQACGIVVGQAAFANGVSKILGHEAGRDAAALVRRIRDMPAEAPERRRMLQAFLSGLKTIWWILLALTLAMVLLSFLTKDFSLKSQEPGTVLLDSDLEKRSTVETSLGRSGHVDEISIDNKTS